MPHEDGGIGVFLDEQLSAREQEELAKKAKRALEALIEKWSDKLKFARSHDKESRKRWAEDRRMARGDTEWLVDTNLIGAIMEVLAAFLYAKNPDISATPSDSVDRILIKEFRLLAKTLEIVISRMFRDAGLKKIAKRWVRSAMTVGISWIKVAMQTRTERDPLMENELNDLQDNLRSMDTLTRTLEEGDATDEDATRAQIESQIIAIKGQMEREVAEGLVLDIHAPEDVVVAPDCGEIENYLCAPWIAFDMYKDQLETLGITGWKLEDLKQADRYTQRPRKGKGEGSTSTSTEWVSLDNEETESAENPEGFYRFTEIWSLTDGVVYTMVHGALKRWARPPFAPRTGKRFYPCFALRFHPVDGERYPQSDVFRLTRLANEYASTRSNFAEHRARAVPGIVFNAAAVKKDSIKKLKGAQVQEYIAIDLVNPNQDMREVFAPKIYNAVDMALYDTDKITAEMEKVSGAQDAIQGAIQIEKTATEANLLESGRSARTGSRLDDLEDVLTEMAEYASQLALLTMDQADAMRYAGPKAKWMEMSTDEALNLFFIEIKAGSTGKPKAAADRQAWGTLMPMIEGMIDRIGQARMMGQEWAALPWIALMVETFDRLDDHSDIEQFLPVPPPEIIQANMRQEMSEAEKAEISEDQSKTLENLASALEKNPLFAGPALQIVREMLAQDQQQDTPVDTNSLEAAPSPV